MRVIDNKIRLSATDVKTIATEIKERAELAYEGEDSMNLQDVEIEVTGGSVFIDCYVSYIYKPYPSHDAYVPDSDELKIYGIDLDRIDATIDDEAYEYLSGDELTEEDYMRIKKELAI